MRQLTCPWIMVSTYIDCLTYKNAATGLVLGGQYGNIGRIAACIAGATSLTVTAALSAALNQYDAFWLFDGANSEQVQVGSGGAAQGATTIPLQSGAAFAHAGGTPYCTDGVQGSLGQAIFEASRQIEDICHQALWSTAYTSEILTMPTMRAAWDNERNLHFRPRHFPITALSSVSVETSTLRSWQYDTTQAIIDADQMTVDLPATALLANSGSTPQQNLTSPWTSGPSREMNAWVTLGYTAGFATGQLPWAVTRAATLLTNESLGLLENPIGADEIHQNKRSVTFTLRGDQSGESLLVKRATAALGPYIAQSF